MIPRYDPTFQYSDLMRAYRWSARRDMNDRLCTELKQFYGVKHVFTFDSARVALFALLRAYDQPGGVLMPAYTCIVVPEAVECAGYRPVFADIDSCALSPSPDTLARAFDPGVTVVLATHLFGMVCDVEQVMSFGRMHNLLVVEDAAPAIGAEYRGQLAGTLSDAAIISFQATKVISAEDGGALLTNNDELANKVAGLLSQVEARTDRWLLLLKAIARKLALEPRTYGLAQRLYSLVRREVMYEIVIPQHENSKTFLKGCSPFTSALVWIQLDRLAQNLSRRRRLAEIYREELPGGRGLQTPTTVENSAPAWIQYPIMVKDKGHFYHFMKRFGIDLSWTYKYSCAESYKADGFQEAHNAAKTVLGLPTYPSLTDDQAHYVCAAARQYSAPK